MSRTHLLPVTVLVVLLACALSYGGVPDAPFDFARAVGLRSRVGDLSAGRPSAVLGATPKLSRDRRSPAASRQQSPGSPQTPSKKMPAAKPAATSPVDLRLEKLKAQAAAEVDSLKDLTQQMVDELFSFGEPGYQEFETQKYCVDILSKNGFNVVKGVAGLPTSWVATWGSGKPVIAIGSDVDSLLETNQKPGIPKREPFVEGAPGHGEGHNTGIPLSITAAMAVKKIMEREHLAGTILIWPGIAEELVAGKAWFVRDGVFKDVDVCLFNHVASDFGVSWGQASSTNGLVSVEYLFKGVTAHAAGAPWQGRSALDAVELMDVGWNFRREHLRLSQRSHMVITNGGSQPNVVPGAASVWYYFRETDYQHIKDLWELGNRMAQAAAMMTDTEVTWRLLGTAWPQHFNKPVAETVYANIKRVGLPKWDDADQSFAKMLQKMMKVPERGLSTQVRELTGPPPAERNMGGGSDDIGDVSWTVPTITLRYPANVPGMQAHHWSSAIAEATPVAHKGVTAGAKVQAMTMLDLLLKQEIVQQAWDYFRNVQTKNEKYIPFVGPDDKPQTWLNRKVMEEYRDRMRPFYFDPSKYPTYLDQLGIPYPPSAATTPAAEHPGLK
jgi:aminobenzoyl-glutamate utilization protein B